MLTRQEMRHHPQVVANGIIVETEHATAGTLRQARPPAHFSHTDFEFRHDAPDYGAHTTEVLTEFGLNDDRIQTLIKSAAIMQAKE